MYLNKKKLWFIIHGLNSCITAINVLLKLFTHIYIGKWGKLYDFLKTILKYKSVKGKKKIASIKKSSFMPKVPFEAVYIMAKPFNPKA